MPWTNPPVVIPSQLAGLNGVLLSGGAVNFSRDQLTVVTAAPAGGVALANYTAPGLPFRQLWLSNLGPNDVWISMDGFATAGQGLRLMPNLAPITLTIAPTAGGIPHGICAAAQTGTVVGIAIQ